MSRWQRPARLALGVLFAAVVVTVLLVMRQRAAQAPPAAPERLDPRAISETRGGDVIQLKGEKRDIRVEFASQVTYEDGRTKLADFKATIENRGGRTFVITGQEAWIGSEASSYDVRGGVTLQTSDGLTAKTQQATFTEAEGILRSTNAVEFQRENMSGSGVGFTYDRQQDALWLLDRAVIRFAATANRPAMEVTAGTAGYSRLQRYARFERNVRMTREEQVTEADASTVFLQAQIDEPDRIELRGQSRIRGGQGIGSVQSMQARDINLDYAGDGRTLEHAVLAGQSSIQLARRDGSAGQRLSAEYIDLSLAPDGAVTGLASRDNVRVELPATADAPMRVVTATSLSGSGEAGKGLTSMTFEDGAEYEEASGAPSAAAALGTPSGMPGARGRTASARTLKAQLTESGTIDAAEFLGGFSFTEGRLSASSGDAQYQISKGIIALSSAKGSRDPHVEDERVTIDAPAIEVTLAPRRMSARGGVRTVLMAGRGRPGDRGNTLLKESEAVNVTADELTFDEQTSKGVYSGNARLFQGSTSIKGDTITLDDREGTLIAIGSVTSVLPIAGRKDDGSQAATSTGRAGAFRFDDAKRRAVFEKDAMLDGIQGNLRADRIELFLAQKSNELERLEARGPIVRVLVEKREATGTELTYRPSDEQYTLVGSPVRFIESCRETTGRTLSFFKASDRITIDGNEEQRVLAKGGSKCPESPR